MSKINISLSLDGTTLFKDRESGLTSGYYQQNEIMKKYKNIFTKDIIKLISHMPKKAKDAFNDTMKSIVELAEGSVKSVFLYCPEVYLHSKVQSAIAKFIVEIAATYDGISIDMHTNSRIFLLKFSDGVIDKRLSPSDISISIKENNTWRHDISFEEDGTLVNYPMFFLSWCY